LFVTGGSNLTNSTRLAGVFFPPIAVFLAAGMWRILSTRRIDGALLLFGFLVAPIPAALLKEDFAVDRELVKLPFVVLIAALGAQWLWSVPSRPSIGRALRFAALGLLVLTVAYGALGLIRDGRLGATIPLGIAAAVAALAIGVALQRTATWSPMVAALLLLLPLMFVPFVRDYFDGYPMRSSGWFGGNIRGAIDSVIASDGRAAAPEIHISTDIPYIRSYWLFYQHVYHREDLAAKSKTFDRSTIDVSTIPSGSLVLASGTDAVVADLASRGELRREAAIKDRDDQSDPDQFIIYRR
jgi:MFS family permease